MTAPDGAVGAGPRPPRQTLAINRARTADFNIRQAGAGDEGVGPESDVVAVGEPRRGILPEGQHAQYRAAVNLQVHTTLQRKRAAQVNPGGNFHRAAAQAVGHAARRRRVDGEGNRLGVGHHPVAHRAIIGDVDDVVGVDPDRPRDNRRRPDRQQQQDGRDCRDQTAPRRALLSKCGRRIVRVMG